MGQRPPERARTIPHRTTLQTTAHRHQLPKGHQSLLHATRRRTTKGPARPRQRANRQRHGRTRPRRRRDHRRLTTRRTSQCPRPKTRRHETPQRRLLVVQRPQTLRHSPTRRLRPRIRKTHPIHNRNDKHQRHNPLPTRTRTMRLLTPPPPHLTISPSRISQFQSPGILIPGTPPTTNPPPKPTPSGGILTPKARACSDDQRQQQQKQSNLNRNPNHSRSNPPKPRELVPWDSPLLHPFPNSSHSLHALSLSTPSPLLSSFHFLLFSPPPSPAPRRGAGL